MQLSKEHYKIAVITALLMICAAIFSHFIFGIGVAELVGSTFDQMWGMLLYIFTLRVWNNS